jgi:hypothetical protein
MKEYGFRVMAMGRTSSWQPRSFGVYNRESAGDGTGDGTGDRFRYKDTGGPGAVDGYLFANDKAVAGANGSMGGARLGWNPVMRPVAMRVSKTPDGDNRVQCWAGYCKAFDYIEKSGAVLDGGQIFMSNHA